MRAAAAQRAAAPPSTPTPPPAVVPATARDADRVRDLEQRNNALQRVLDAHRMRSEMLQSAAGQTSRRQSSNDCAHISAYEAASQQQQRSKAASNVTTSHRRAHACVKY
eukprot:3345385-Pleurochrysis_carterae.AAC.1